MCWRIQNATLGVKNIKVKGRNRTCTYQKRIISESIALLNYSQVL